MGISFFWWNHLWKFNEKEKEKEKDKEKEKRKRKIKEKKKSPPPPGGTPVGCGASRPNECQQLGAPVARHCESESLNIW